MTRRSRLLALTVLAAASLAAPAAKVEGNSLVVPAWAFARGNGRVHANPNEYADAGPVVGSGPRQPWGWTVEYDVDVPVAVEVPRGYSAALGRGRDMVAD